MNTLHDIFRKRATSTMQQRSGSLGLLYGWLAALFPEDPVLRLCMSCQGDQQVGKQIVHVVDIEYFLVGKVFMVPGALECVASPRIDGVAHGQFLAKRPRLRASMLSPSSRQSGSWVLHDVCNGKAKMLRCRADPAC